jgi:hypothetical protein
VELLLEFVLEFVGQFLIELVVEKGFRGVARFLSSRAGRVALGLSLALAVGFAGGYWWGSRLSETGRTAEPSSLWVSIALAALFGILAVARLVRRGRPTTPARVPWRWPPGRLAGFAVLNGAVALGIAVGFEPMPPLR